MEKQQLAQLKKLLKLAKNTEFGKAHSFSSLKTYSEFVSNVPVQTYEDLKEGVERLKLGAENIYWPGKVTCFAVSSGTTGEGKHIPITNERLKSDARFRRKVISELVFSRFGYKLFGGKHISLPGSLEFIQNENHSYWIGEISGISSLAVPKWVQGLQLLPLNQTREYTINEKVEFILKNATNSDVRSIAGAPTWIEKVLSEVKNRTGKRIKDVWPNFTAIISGGVAYKHYQQSINEILDGEKIQVIEMYGASEWYVGHSEVNAISQMKISLNEACFFEAKDVLTGIIIPFYQAEMGKEYSIYVTNNSGLWRYPLKDTIQLVAKNTIEITGRTDSMIDYFGEALLVSEVKQAFKTINIIPNRLILLPSTNPNSILLVVDLKDSDWSRVSAQQIDQAIIEINRHYAIRRGSDTLGIIKIERWTKEFESKYYQSLPQKAQLKIPEVINKPDFFAK